MFVLVVVINCEINCERIAYIAYAVLHLCENVNI